MTTPRGLTQPFTSFIGSACQGIHHAPLITNTQTTTHKHAGGHTSELDKKLTKEKRNHTNTHNTPHKSAACHECLMLASTIQFSHNTPTTPHQHTQCQQDSWSGTQKRGNNAPDTQQCTNIQTIYFYYCARHVCHKAPFKHLVMSYRVCVSPGQFFQQ